MTAVHKRRDERTKKALQSALRNAEPHQFIARRPRVTYIMANCLQLCLDHAEMSTSLVCRSVTSGGLPGANPMACRSLADGFLPADASFRAPMTPLNLCIPECRILREVWYCRWEIARCLFQYRSRRS